MRAALLTIAGAGVLSACVLGGTSAATTQGETRLELPQPQVTGTVPVEQALQSRRSVREFRRQALTLADVSQLLWAAQGITEGRFRTAPSAGALYPLEVYVAIGRVEDTATGVYRYDPATHSLTVVRSGDMLRSLERAAIGQEWVAGGAIALVFTAVNERTTGKYGDRGIRYVHMEAGHAAQNVYLQAEAMGLGTVVVGAFRDGAVRDVLQIPDDEQPLSIMPVGKPRR